MELLGGGMALPVAGPWMLHWVFGGAAERVSARRGRLAPVAVAGLIALAVAVFGGLFAAADAAFRGLIGALDLLFVAFCAVQVVVLLATDRDAILRSTGLTYAE